MGRGKKFGELDRARFGGFSNNGRGVGGVLNIKRVGGGNDMVYGIIDRGGGIIIELGWTRGEIALVDIDFRLKEGVMEVLFGSRTVTRLDRFLGED